MNKVIAVAEPPKGLEVPALNSWGVFTSSMQLCVGI